MLFMSIKQADNIPLVPGRPKELVIEIKNMSENIYLYNMTIGIKLPDGMVFEGSSEEQTTGGRKADGTSEYTFVNIKDLAPMEVDYTFTFKVSSSGYFINGEPVSFGQLFPLFQMSCQMDTMPRGDYDANNEKISEGLTLSFEAVRFKCTLSTPGRVLKGAGTSETKEDYTQIEKATCTFENNSVEESVIGAKILLPKSIRYIGALETDGVDGDLFENPTISDVVIDDVAYTQIHFSGIKMGIDGEAKVTFAYAIWNRYGETKVLCQHGHTIEMMLSMFDAAYQVEVMACIMAMDLMITNTIIPSGLAIGMNVSFQTMFQIGGYYDLRDVRVEYEMPDAVIYLESTIPETSAYDNAETKGYKVIHELPMAIKNSTGTIESIGEVSTFYRHSVDEFGHTIPIAAFDLLEGTNRIVGTIVSTGNEISDEATASAHIEVPTLSKSLIGAYYQDESPKSSLALAPGDFAEYMLTYDASQLGAEQKDIVLYDFFPLAVDAIESIEYVYTGYGAEEMVSDLAEPHGVMFEYGTVPKNTFLTIRYKMPINKEPQEGEQNNLFKCSGMNTQGLRYSSRVQIPVAVATPHIKLTKEITGPNKSGVRKGERYTYTVTVTNDIAEDVGVDAFNFVLSETLSSWFILDESTITLEGTGDYGAVQVSTERLEVPINQLAPGESLTLTYEVQIIDEMAPHVRIKTAAETTAPYAQKNDETSYQYVDQARVVTKYISSKGLTVEKTADTTLLKIGSEVEYVITVKVPIGTMIYDASLVDYLPNNQQSYLSEATRDGEVVEVTVDGNDVIFPGEMVDAREEEVTVVYKLLCKIIDGDKPVGATSITQYNNCRLFFRQSENGSKKKITRKLEVPIQVPNIAIALAVTDLTTSTIYKEEGSISSNDELSFEVICKNDSKIPLINAEVTVPLDVYYTFLGIEYTRKSTANYVVAEECVKIFIPVLAADESCLVIFKIRPKVNTPAMHTIITQAVAKSYRNDVYSKGYGGERSNEVAIHFDAGVSLLPDPINRVDDETSFRISYPGSIVIIENFFRNTGGGMDDYRFAVAPVEIPYSIYIDDLFIGQVEGDTPYEEELEVMKNIPSGTEKVIRLVTRLPIVMPLGTRYDFDITITSLSDETKKKTVYNIDPKR